MPASDVLSSDWWLVFLTVTGVTSLITYGFQEKAARWHSRGLVGKRAVMWAEILAVPVCCALGWYSIYQAPVEFIGPWAGLLAGLLGSMASPWFLSLIGRLINKKLGKDEENDKGQPPADPHPTSRPGSSATPNTGS